MQADIRISKQETGKSFCLKMPEKRYEISTEDQRKLELTYCFTQYQPWYNEPHNRH